MGSPLRWRGVCIVICATLLLPVGLCDARPS